LKNNTSSPTNNPFQNEDTSLTDSPLQDEVISLVIDGSLQDEVISSTASHRSNNLLLEASSTTGPTNEQLMQIHEDIISIIKTEKDRRTFASFLQKAKVRISIENESMNPPQFTSHSKVDPKKIIRKQRRIYSNKKKNDRSKKRDRETQTTTTEKNSFYFRSLSS